MDGRRFAGVRGSRPVAIPLYQPRADRLADDAAHGKCQLAHGVLPSADFDSFRQLEKRQVALRPPGKICSETWLANCGGIPFRMAPRPGEIVTDLTYKMSMAHDADTCFAHLHNG